MKKSKTKTKTEEVQRKEGEKNQQRKPSLEGKDIEFENVSIEIEENSSSRENKEPENEVVLLDQFEKDNASQIQSDSGVEVGKEGGNQEKYKEEIDFKEEEEEEGDIEMATPRNKKARGRKSTE